MIDTAPVIFTSEHEQPRLQRRWYPMGYPVEVVTGATEVLAAADTLWSAYPPLADTSPVELTIDLSPSEAPLSPAAPCHHGHFFAMVQNSENFAIADMLAGVGIFKVSRSALRNQAWFSYSFLEPIAYVLLGAKHFTMVHAAAIELDGRAVLLCGPSGAGKTCLAYACCRRGWSFLTGDAAQLVRSEREPAVVGRPFSIRFRYSAKSVFPELRRYPATLRPNGKCDVELDPRDLGLSVSLKARAAAVVFLDRDANARKATIQPVQPRDAKRMLVEPVQLGNAQILAEQETALDRLIEKPCVRLTYSDPFQAESALRSLVEPL